MNSSETINQNNIQTPKQEDEYSNFIIELIDILNKSYI